METEIISFRLRKVLDVDIIEATRNMTKKEKGELARNGMRLMLGIRTTRTVEVKEKPLTLPEERPEEREKTTKLPGKPAVFIQNQKRNN